MPPTSAQLASLYADAVAHMSRWLTQGTDFRRHTAAHLLHQVDEIAGRLGYEATQLAARAAEEQYRKGLASTDNDLRNIGITVAQPPSAVGFAGRFDRINEKSVEVLARDMGRDLLRANQELADRTKRVIRRTAQLAVADADVSRAVASGLIAGGGTRAVAKNLQQKFAEGEARRLVAENKIKPDLAEEMTRVSDGFIQVGKMQLRIKDYAETVAVTRLAEAQTLATEDRVQQAGLDLIIITGPRTSDFCDYFVGRVFSLSGNDDNYPSLSELPGGGAPFHPRCTHGEAAFVPAFATDNELKRAAGFDDRLLGKTPGEAQAIYRQAVADGDAPRPNEVSGMKAAEN